MDIKEIIESKFGLTVHDIFVKGQGFDSVAYLVNNEYIFKQSKHNQSRINLKKRNTGIKLSERQSHFTDTRY